VTDRAAHRGQVQGLTLAGGRPGTFGAEIVPTPPVQPFVALGGLAPNGDPVRSDHGVDPCVDSRGFLRALDPDLLLSERGRERPPAGLLVSASVLGALLCVRHEVSFARYLARVTWWPRVRGRAGGSARRRSRGGCPAIRFRRYRSPRQPVRRECTHAGRRLCCSEVPSSLPRQWLPQPCDTDSLPISMRALGRPPRMRR